eukprot:5199578-Prorocentrum_lima.AAC.1
MELQREMGSFRSVLLRSHEGMRRCVLTPVNHAQPNDTREGEAPEDFNEKEQTKRLSQGAAAAAERRYAELNRKRWHVVAKKQRFR